MLVPSLPSVVKIDRAEEVSHARSGHVGVEARRNRSDRANRGRFAEAGLSWNFQVIAPNDLRGI
jgi:hypothetical protein